MSMSSTDHAFGLPPKLRYACPSARTSEHSGAVIHIRDISSCSGVQALQWLLSIHRHVPSSKRPYGRTSGGGKSRAAKDAFSRDKSYDAS